MLWFYISLKYHYHLNKYYNIENHQLKVNILSVLLGANEELTALDIAPILKLTTQKTSALLMQLCQEKIVIRINRNNKSYYKLA
jgi:predicted transcriptional regulator